MADDVSCRRRRRSAERCCAERSAYLLSAVKSLNCFAVTMRMTVNLIIDGFRSVVASSCYNSRRELQYHSTTKSDTTLKCIDEVLLLKLKKSCMKSERIDSVEMDCSILHGI
jgi:hypothetical protein